MKLTDENKIEMYRLKKEGYPNKIYKRTKEKTPRRLFWLFRERQI